MTRILKCQCNDCTHWEIIDIDGLTHLHCKTCKRNDEVDLVVHPAQPATWVEVENHGEV